MKTLCTIYKSAKEDELYLYVLKGNGLKRVPEALLEKFGKPILVTTMVLSADKKLARADVGKVLAAMEQNGFYLQMPPAKEEYMLEVNLHNHKLAGK